MKNKLDALHIELYGGGQFQGYLKSVSTYHQHVDSTLNKADAKAYARFETAQKDCQLVGLLTAGGLNTNIV